MLTPSRTFHQPGLFGIDLLLQLDPTDPLLKLATEISWHKFDEAFSIHYAEAANAPSQTDPVDGWVIDTKATEECKR